MKAITLFVVFYFLLFASCIRDKSLDLSFYQYDPNAKLKKKMLFESKESRIPLAIDDYEYNSNDKISKISYYSGNYNHLVYYEVFKYKADTLDYKVRFHRNINSEYHLRDSTIFQYENDKLVHEKIFSTPAYYRENYKYEYSNDNLIKKSKKAMSSFSSTWSVIIRYEYY
jgi:hypothetical protein